MHDWIDLQLARQRREELLREAHERRITRASVRKPGRELMTPIRRLISSLQPARNGGLAAAEKPGVPIQGCSAD
jgi:hypothetical protein